MACVSTNLAYVDHLPPGASVGQHYHQGVEEIYYVLNGDGQVEVNGGTAPIHKGDGVPIRFDEAHSFVNHGSAEPELMIVGISAQKAQVAASVCGNLYLETSWCIGEDIRWMIDTIGADRVMLGLIYPATFR